MVSNELVAYQEGSVLFNSIVEIFKASKGQPKFKTKELNKTPLPEIIKKHTGISVNFNTDYSNDYNAYVIVPDLSLNNVLYDDFLREFLDNNDYEELKRANKKLEGTVNPKTSKVSGIFSEIVSDITLGDRFWNKEGIITPEETAAILLHEIGHVFSYYFFLLKTVKTNIVLNALNRPEYFNSSKDKKIIFLEEIEKDMDFKITDKEQLTACNQETTNIVIISESIRAERSELKTDLYDQRTYEFLSDQFSMAHGAGIHLATGLAKIMKLYGATTDSKFIYVTKSLIGLIRFILFHLLGYKTGKISTIILFWIALIFSNTVPQRELYDSPLVRLRKIKEQLMGILKDRNLDRDFKMQTISDIETIDFLTKRYMESPDITDILMKKLLPWARKRESISKLQHDYESLAYNDFYKLSAKMSV